MGLKMKRRPDKKKVKSVLKKKQKAFPRAISCAFSHAISCAFSQCSNCTQTLKEKKKSGEQSVLKFKPKNETNPLPN